MQNDCCGCSREISVGELRQQIEYARIIGGDLFNLFARKSDKNAVQAHEYPVIEKKLSMILDFLFQAGLWCDVIEDGIATDGCINEKEEA